ncbi:MAG: FecR domain-containing protein [Pigmentiphaga sp.]
MAFSDDVQAGAMEAIDRQALDWYVRAREGLDASQRLEFDAWLSHSPHRVAYDRWAAEWQALDQLPPAAVQALGQGQGQGGGAATSLAGWSRRRVLAGAALCASAAGAGLWVHRSRPEFVREYAVAVGGLERAALPDGSLADLDSATRLAVAYYADRREITLLQGQMLLDVSHDPRRPFHVLADDVRVSVTGTRFSVRHTPGQAGFEDVRVAVAAGSVRVTPVVRSGAWLAWLRRPAPTELAPGQQLLAGRSWQIAPLPVADVAAWHESRLVVNNLSLAQVLGEFARYGHSVPRIDDVRVAGMRLGGSFHLRQPSAFYRILPQILPVTVEEEAGGRQVIRAVRV